MITFADERPSKLDRIVVALLMMFALAGLAVWGRALLLGGPAATNARSTWPRDQLAVAARLKQTQPTDFGQVWLTRDGLTCGLVDAWTSFGGVLGMTPFYVQAGRVVFAQDVDGLIFARNWRGCLNDTWIVLHEGTLTPGRCGTRRVKRFCRPIV